MVVQGSPGLSDFRGVQDPALAAPQSAGINGNDPLNEDAFASELSTAHGGAIAAAIVSEYAVPARSAETKSDMTRDGRGVRGETSGGVLPMGDIQRRIREIVAKLREQERPP